MFIILFKVFSDKVLRPRENVAKPRKNTLDTELFHQALAQALVLHETN